MKIAALGTGMAGRTLASRLAGLGHATLAGVLGTFQFNIAIARA